MPLTLKFTTAHGVLNVPVDEPTPRSDETRRTLADALQGEFELRAEGPLPDEAPPDVAFIVLPGHSTQIAFSQLQADIEIQFREAYERNAEMARGLVAEKIERLFHAWERVGARPVWEGLIVTLQASTMGQDESQVRHMLNTHLREGLDSDALHDAKLQLGLRLQDRYFATLSVGHYEARMVQRQVTPGMAVLGPIRPWEGELSDEGLELTVDVNNRYGALVERRHSRVTEDDLRALTNLTWELIEHVAIPFATDGVLDLSGIQRAAV